MSQDRSSGACSLSSVPRSIYQKPTDIDEFYVPCRFRIDVRKPYQAQQPAFNLLCGASLGVTWLSGAIDVEFQMVDDSRCRSIQTVSMENLTLLLRLATGPLGCVRK
jgi:hypothetical protein